MNCEECGGGGTVNSQRECEACHNPYSSWEPCPVCNGRGNVCHPVETHTYGGEVFEVWPVRRHGSGSLSVFRPYGMDNRDRYSCGVHSACGQPWFGGGWVYTITPNEPEIHPLPYAWKTPRGALRLYPTPNRTLVFPDGVLARKKQEEEK